MANSDGWTSRLGVVLAVAGSAVGLGNFLRFPGQAAENGGGAFMIPYFIAFLLLGIPICWAEWTMGRKGGLKGFHSCPAILGALTGRKSFRYVGVIGVIIPLIVYMYYVVIEAWCLGYALYFLTGSFDLGTDPNNYAQASKNFFSDFVGLQSDGALLQGGIAPVFIFWIIVFAINFTLIYRGIAKGIESFCKYALPCMAISALIVLIRVLTLGTPNPSYPDQNVLNGLGFMWNPRGVGEGVDWIESLMNPKVWLAATGQIFFTLSVGFGVIINYASYLKKKDDVVLSGLTAAATNETFEVCFGGLITVTAAFIFLGAAGAVGGTFGLGFNTLPVVFAYMPAGNIFGFIWFFMLFLAAITSSVSMLQPAIAFLEEALGIGRKASVAFLGLITGMGSLFVLYFSKDLKALDTLDFWVGTFLIFVLATILVIVFGWIWGVDKGIESAHEGAEIKIPRIYRFILLYVSPVYLLCIFTGWCILNLPDYVQQLQRDPVAMLSIGVIVSVFIFLCIIVSIADKRWSR